MTNPRWPFIFVLLSLLALGALPFLTIGAIAIYRRDIQVGKGSTFTLWLPNQAPARS